MAEAGRRVLLGRVVGIYGVRGEVKIESFTEPRLAIFDYRPWLLERAPGVIEAIHGAHGRGQGKGVIANLPGVTNRDGAAQWIGASIGALRSALPALPVGEVYRADLEGLEVVNTRGEPLGRVSHLFDTGAHPVLVTRDAAGRERLIPYVAARYVQSVDLEAGRIVVDWELDD